MLVCIFGKRGSGKTTTIKGQLKDCKPPIVVLDILGNFHDVEAIHTDSTARAIRFLDDFRENPDTKETLIVVKTADPTLTVDYMSVALKETGGTLVLDEVDGFDIRNAPCFDQLVRYGRNWDVSLLTGCRRLAEVSRNITAGANKIFCFGTHEPRDIDYFKATIFGENAEKLLKVEKYSGLYVDYDLAETGLFKIDKAGHIYIMSRTSF